MRRRNGSLTESLEPRLVLSAVSPRGSVDPPRDSSADSEPRTESDAVASSGDGQSQAVRSSRRQRSTDEVSYSPVDDTRGVPPVAVAEGGSTSLTAVTAFNDDRSNLNDGGVRADSWNDGTLVDDLTGDSLSADDRTSALIDPAVDADGARAEDVSDAEESVGLIAAGVDSSSGSPSVSSDHSVSYGHDGTAADGSATRIGSVGRPAAGRAGQGVQDTVISMRSSSPSPEPSPEPVFPDTGSWLSSLASSLKSWLALEGLGAETSTTIAETRVPFVAIAGGFTLAAAGRKGMVEGDADDFEESGGGLSKSERRAGRVTDRRRCRWIDFLTKHRTAHRCGEVALERPASPVNLAEPDVSEAFAMSLLQPVSRESFLLTPIHEAEKSEESESSEADSFWSPEIVASGAVAVAGGTVMRRARHGQRRTTHRPVIDYTGTTRPQT